MRCGYVVPMRWMVIYGYGVPEGVLNLNSTNYPDHGHHGDSPLWGKNPHGRAGNWTLDLMISSQKCWPLDHEAGLIIKYFNLLYALQCVRWSAESTKWRGSVSVPRFIMEFYSTDLLSGWAHFCVVGFTDFVTSGYTVLFRKPRPYSAQVLKQNLQRIEWQVHF
jgi:hypothetical protein